MVSATESEFNLKDGVGMAIKLKRVARIVKS